MEEGQKVGAKARELYPSGVLISAPDIESASLKTRKLMDDPSTVVIFEGTFLVDEFATKADMLIRNDDAWHLIEVKSSVNDKPEFIDDMAYTAMVMDRSGISISQISLLLVSKDYRIGMPDERFFIELNKTTEVLQQLDAFKTCWDEIDSITKNPDEPNHELHLICRKCDQFEGCLGEGNENHIFDIPRLSQVKFDKLKALDIICIDDIPDGFDLTDNQARVRDCVKTNRPLVGPGLKTNLDTIHWPALYLDFETVKTAIPLYPDVAPHKQIPTQYSVHICSEPGETIDHRFYLADPGRDCRRELAESLIRDCDGTGSILIYTSFEKTIIKGLIDEYPDFAGDLNLLIDRMVDLEAIIKKNFNHPDFCGSTSIKKTLPALVSDISYDSLDISDGDSASAVFAYIAIGKYTGEEAEKLKENLLEYCKMDTLGMVKLHECLITYI
jgi:hypothetical protein